MSDLVAIRYPRFVILAHELIHAYHNCMGRSALHTCRCDRMVWSHDEEYHTIMGFPSKNPERKQPKITENAILASLGLPDRFGHASLSWLKDNPVFLQRVQLAARVYSQFRLESGRGGQAQVSPPPIINCRAEDLGESHRSILLYRVATPDDPSERPVMKPLPLGVDPPEGLVRYEFAVDLGPPWLRLQETWPSFFSREVMNRKGRVAAIGIYRLSMREEKILYQPPVTKPTGVRLLASKLREVVRGILK